MPKLTLVYVALALVGWALACSGDESSSMAPSPSSLGSYGESLLDDGSTTSDQ